MKACATKRAPLSIMVKPLLVRDVMTIGVPVCRDTETCGEVTARLARQDSRAEVVVALDEDGMSCGWTTLERLVTEPGNRPVGEVMDEDIPTVPPDIPAEAAAQLMRDRGVEYLFLMHDWPGEPRPSAVISLRNIEQRIE
ncbi:MAG: CBS domain-containing protein [Chloroflexi bacterium]|nr:CBS domain-containing protein [Chloroflexota bacterium]